MPDIMMPIRVMMTMFQMETPARSCAEAGVHRARTQPAQ
jgi:hypothetical protein